MAGKERGKKPSPLPLRFQQWGKKVKNGVKQEKYRERREPSGSLGKEKKRHSFPSPDRPLRSLRSPIFFFFPQRGAWSQITWFLPLLLSLRFVILRYNSKYQSKGQIYILHLFAFQKEQQKQKTGFRKATKKVRDARMNANAGSAPLPTPPLQTMTDANKVKLSVRPFNIEAIAHLNKRNV